MLVDTLAKVEELESSLNQINEDIKHIRKQAMDLVDIAIIEVAEQD